MVVLVRVAPTVPRDSLAPLESPVNPVHRVFKDRLVKTELRVLKVSPESAVFPDPPVLRARAVPQDLLEPLEKWARRALLELLVLLVPLDQLVSKVFLDL